MSTKEIVQLVCDNKRKHEGQPVDDLAEHPTKRYTIWSGSQTKTIDLCATCAAPLEALLEIRLKARYPHVRTARPRKIPRKSRTSQQGE